MKRLVLAFSILALPQLSFAAETIRPPGVAAGPSDSSVPSGQRGGYRYEHAPTPLAQKKWYSCGHIDVGVEALFWRPAHAGFFYVKVSEGELATALRVKPGYDWGVRGYVGYSFPACWDARIAYTYFDARYADSRSRDSESPPILTPVFGPGIDPAPQRFASGKVHEKFQTVDFDVGNILCCTPHFQFKAFGGGRWVEIRGYERYTYINFMDTQCFETQQTSFCGAGPRFGVSSSFYPIPCGACQGFSIDGMLATSILVARRFNELNGTLDFFFTSVSDVRHPKATVVTPAFDAKLKLNYCFDWNCLNWTVYVAYELQWYESSLERIIGTTGLSFPSTQVFGTGYAGWSFGLRLKC